MAYLSELIVFIAGLSAVWSLSITTEPTTEIRKPGQEVTLKCEMSADWNPVTNPLTWTKIQGEEETPMSNNLQQIAPFTGTRFPKIPEDTTPLLINPTIKDLKAEDSGHYRCDVGPMSVTHALWVAEEIDTVQIWGSSDPDNMDPDAEELMFEEGKESTVECYVSGGVPQPNLRLIYSGSGGRPYDDDELSSGGDTNITGEIKGMKLYQFTTWLKHEKLMLDAAADRESLKCEALIGDMTDFTKSAEKTISMLYIPWMGQNNCSMAKVDKDGETFVNVVCTFKANPSPTAVEWAEAGTGTKLEGSELIELVGDNRYEAKVQFPMGDDDDVRLKLSLTNPVGTKDYEFDIRGDVIGYVTDDSVPLTAPWSLVLTLLILALAWK